MLGQRKEKGILKDVSLAGHVDISPNRRQHFRVAELMCTRRGSEVLHGQQQVVSVKQRCWTLPADRSSGLWSVRTHWWDQYKEPPSYICFSFS